MLLAIDASTAWASLALLDGDQVRAHRTWQVGQQHSVEIFAAIEGVLTEGRAKRADITAIGVAIGPGSFNGTRVGVTVAKTLAFIWNVPLVGVSTLAAIAQTQVGNAGEAVIVAILEAGRDEVYVGWYDHYTGLVSGRGDAQIATVADIVRTAEDAPDATMIIAGEISDTHREALIASLGTRGRLATPLSPPDRAIGVGQVAQARLARGETDSPLALEPTYIRRPNISVSARHPITAPTETARG